MNVTATNAYAANTTGLSIDVTIGGVLVPLPNNQLMTNITVDANNEVFTVTESGNYFISYHVNTTVALLLSTGILINGSLYTASVLDPVLSTSSYVAEVIVTLSASDNIALQFVGALGIITLLSDGVGASLTIIRLS